MTTKLRAEQDIRDELARRLREARRLAAFGQGYEDYSEAIDTQTAIASGLAYSLSLDLSETFCKIKEGYKLL